MFNNKFETSFISSVCTACERAQTGDLNAAYL